MNVSLADLATVIARHLISTMILSSSVRYLVILSMLCVSTGLSTSRFCISSRSLRCMIRQKPVKLGSGRYLEMCTEGAPTTASAGGRKSSAVVQSTKKAEKISPMDLQPPKGTRDFYPEDKRLQNWLFDKWRAIAIRQGFEEYDAPVVESEDLYIRKAGEEVTQQLYNFEDKGGRRLSLRPEMTPSLSRMVLAKKGALSFPLKWFSIPQCWRYERMTRGRRREHYQWNMDIWGVSGVEAEAELLSAIVTSFKELGINESDVGIKVNSRKILSGLMGALGVTEDKFAATCVLIDKLEKVPLDAIQGDLTALGLTNDIVNELMMALKEPNLDSFEMRLGKDSEGVKDLKRLFALAEAYGFRDWLVFDPTVVRGLAYYTGVVFEGFDKKGELRAICGGGRYDKLLESFGGEAIPAVGFGFGDAVIIELLKNKELMPDTSAADVDVVVFAQEEALYAKAVKTACLLRASGLRVELVMEAKKMKWVFQRADRVKAGVVVLHSLDEDKVGAVVVKDMKRGEQRTAGIDDVREAVSAILMMNEE